jgi:Ion channel
LPLESAFSRSPSRSAAAPAIPRTQQTAAKEIGLREQLVSALLDFIDGLSTSQLFVTWLAVILACGCAYWLINLSGAAGLQQAGERVGANLNGLLTSIYFSFITATSVGYGDVLPLGATRILAVAEAVAGLLLFGLLIAKFVSYRQDMLVREIHSVTFEERLDRVQTNLHLVISELLTIAALCDDGAARLERLGPRLDTTTLVFMTELHTIHELLYNPRWMPEETVLGGILANLASALNMLGQVLVCLPLNLRNSPGLKTTLKTVSLLADDICADCVPQVYAPALTAWMDRIQLAARAIV